MGLAASMLLWCAQEAQRSVKGHDELVQSEVQGTALAGRVAAMPAERERAEAVRTPRRSPSLPGPYDGFERIEFDGSWPGPGLDGLFRAGGDLLAGLFLIGDEPPSVALGPGHGSSFYAGESDLDFLATRHARRGVASTALTATVSVDWSGYESAFAGGLEGRGPGVKEVQFNASHRTPDGHGLGLFAARSQPLDEALASIAATPVADALGDRVGVDGWLALGSSLQLYARAEQRSERGDSGASWRAGAAWRDPFGVGWPILLETYGDSDESGHSAGVRAVGRKRFSFGAVGLSWSATDTEHESVDEKLLQHAVRADLDFALGRAWFLGLYAESQFGDDQDEVALGFALQLGID